MGKQEGKRKTTIKMGVKIVLGITFALAGFTAPESGWSLGYFLTAEICGGAMLLWAFWPTIQKNRQTQTDLCHTSSQLANPGRPPHKQIPRKDKIDGLPLAYNYVLPFMPATDPHPGEEMEALVDLDGDTILYLVDGVIVGKTKHVKQAQMVADFKRSGDPCIAYILRFRDGVNLRFFRDRRRGQEWREQAVIVPISFKGTSRQEEISVLAPGDPLELDEDEDPGSILYHGEPIAKLPDKERKRAEEEGIYGLFVEDVTTDEEAIDEYSGDYKTIYTPHIRIIWTNRSK